MSKSTVFAAIALILLAACDSKKIEKASEIVDKFKNQSDANNIHSALIIIKQYETLIEVANNGEKEAKDLSFDSIGMPPPTNEIFEFKKIKNGISAVSKKDIGYCPAGSRWESVFTLKDQEFTFIHAVSDENCKSLTPKFIIE